MSTSRSESGSFSDEESNASQHADSSIDRGPVDREKPDEFSNNWMQEIWQKLSEEFEESEEADVEEVTLRETAPKNAMPQEAMPQEAVELLMDIWVAISMQDPSFFWLLSALTKNHYRALNDAWKGYARRDFTEDPILRKQENYRGYYARIAKKFEASLLPSGEMRLEGIDNYAKHKYLRVAIKYNLEKLADKLIKYAVANKNIEMEPDNFYLHLYNNFLGYGDSLFSQIGKRSKRKPDVVKLLIEFSKHFDETTQLNMLYSAEHSFPFIGEPRTFVRSVFHDADVISALISGRERITGVKKEFELNDDPDSVKKTMNILMSYATYLNDMKILMDVKNAPSIEDVFFFMCVVSSIKISKNAVKVAHAIPVLLNLLESEQREMLVNKLFNTMAAIFNSDDILKIPSDIPLYSKKIIVDYVNRRGLEEFKEEYFSGIKYFNAFSKAMYAYMTVYDAPTVAAFFAKLPSSEFQQLIPLADENQDYYVASLKLAIAGNLDIEKIKFLFEQIAEDKRINVMASILWNLKKDVVAGIVDVDAVFTLLRKKELLWSVMKSFLQSDLKSIPVKFIRHFPDMPWQQLLQEMIEEKLHARDDGRDLGAMLAGYNENPLLHSVLMDIVTDIVDSKDEAKAKYFLEKIPQNLSGVILPVMHYLRKRIELDPGNIDIFSAFYDSYVASKRENGRVIYDIAIFDVSKGTNILSCFFKIKKILLNDVRDALSMASSMPIVQDFIFGLLHKRAQMNILINIFVFCMDSKDPKVVFGKSFSRIFNGLTRGRQDKLLVEFINLQAIGSTSDVVNTLRFCLNTLGISQIRYISLAADILFSYLESDWKLTSAKHLLFWQADKEVLPLGSFRRTNEQSLHSLVQPIVMLALCAAINNKLNQMIIGLIKLTVAWDVLTTDQINEIIEHIKNDSPLEEEEKEFLTASLLPPNVAERRVPELAALPSQVGFYKPALPVNNIKNESEVISAAFTATCNTYINDFKIIENKHTKLAKLIVECLNEAKKISGIESFELYANKIILYALLNFFADRNSENFAKRVQTFIEKFPFLLSDKDIFKEKYADEIKAVTNRFKENNGSVNLLAENIITKLALGYTNNVMKNTI